MSQVVLPPEVEAYVKDKITNSGKGRPHLLAGFNDPLEELLKMLELLWLKDKTRGWVARKYETSYSTIWRILQELEPYKGRIVDYLEGAPRRKMFFNRELETSDFDSVQSYVDHAKRKGLKKWRRNLKMAQNVYKALGFKDPRNWDVDEIYAFLNVIGRGSSRNMYIDAIRMVAPQTREKASRHYLETERDDIPRHKKEIFFKEYLMIIEALQAEGLTFHAMIFRLHVTLGAREGSTDTKSGLTGISWDQFKRQFTYVDVWETKVKRGFWCRNCPVDLMFPDLPMQLKELWKTRGKPTMDKVILGGYNELLKIYKEMRQAITRYWDGKLEPSIFTELTTLRPHDADKIHCNLLFEAGASIEDIAGEYQGGNEGWGKMGRIWVDIGTIWKYYLNYGARSQRFKHKKALVQANFTRALAGEPLQYEEMPALQMGALTSGKR